ncbi:MAG: glycosyltransferase [Cyanobacteria bacterium J06635_15]
MTLGVSVIICCHNSAQELPPTLQHLATQQVSPDLPWEVVVIDNASVDTTAQVAQTCWPQEAPAPLRIVHEPKLGLINARYRALAEAKYEILSFIDDDNWVCPIWVQTVAELMAKRPEVGACGGQNIPEFDGQKPGWFDLNGKSYAVGIQGPESGGDITWSQARLLGAGLTIRKSAWQQLVDNGFRSLLVGCKGKALNRGEDTELCFALVLAGWHLWYEPRLQLRHFLTADRLHWRYLRKLRRGGGRATLGFDPYRFALETCDRNHRITFWWEVNQPSAQQPIQPIWRQQFLTALRDLLSRPRVLVQSLIWPMEGDKNALKVETQIGRLTELFRERDTYDVNIKAVREAAWRKEVSSTDLA